MSSNGHTTIPTRNSALAEALDAAERSWHVFPLAPKKKVPLLGTHSFYDATTSPEVIQRWASERRGCNFGLRTGQPSGVVVIEHDPHRGGEETLARIQQQFGKLPHTPMVESPRGGLHHYFAHTDALKSRKDFWGEGVELKADGAYVALPGSRNTHGAYRWKLRPVGAALAPLPAWVCETTAQAQDDEGIVSEISEAISDLSETAEARTRLSDLSETCSVDRVIALTLPARAGERNDCVLKLARALKFNLRMKDAAAPMLRGIVCDWHEQALNVIETKSFDLTWSDFLHAFARARYPLGSDVVDRAMRSLGRPPAAVRQYSDPKVQKLVCLCHALGKMNQGRFFLSSHVAANHIGIEQRTVSRLLIMLCTDGVIERVGRANNYQAFRYRWLSKDDT